MKTWRMLLILLTALLIPYHTAAEKPSGQAVPKYDRSTEAVFKGTVDDAHDRQCPVSGGIGSHLELKQADGSLIEVHLSLTRLVRQYELVFKKGDVIEVTGVKVKFEGVDTIFAGKVRRGNDEFLFRDNDGTPLW